MLDIVEFKKLMQKLSTLTGKSPLIYGRQPKKDNEINYAVEIFYEELKQHNPVDIVSAFTDKELMREVSAGYSLNVYILEKYIHIYKNRRTGKTKETIGGLGDFIKPSAKDIAALDEIGIDVNRLAGDKAL